MICPIVDVRIVKLKTFEDLRGSFCESFRNEWLPDGSKQILQMNLSRSKAGVLRGLHYHQHQFDWWVCVSGKLRVGLFDFRKTSSSEGICFAMDLLPQEYGVFIPPGVAHGFYAVEDSCLTYLVDQTYNPKDELGILWDSVNVDWNLKGSPILSDRDKNNPHIRDIR